MKVTIHTTDGPATIEVAEDWQTLGSVTVTGQGAKKAKAWLQVTPGAFGNFIGGYAAPLDLHCAAMQLQEHPEPEITLLSFEGEVQPYDSGVPADALT